MVSNAANGGKPKAQAEHPDLDAVAGPSLVSQVWDRTVETMAHCLVMVVTCCPILLANYLFRQGLDQFGRFGLDCGMLPAHAVVWYFHFFMLLSSVICWLLLLSLTLHYLSHEFQGQAFPICSVLLRHPAAHFLFKTWTGFSYLQGAMFWMSSVMVCVFVISGLVGLVLHLFTNMFFVTSLIGMVATGYIQFTFFAAIVAEVHGEIHHAQVVMDKLVDALSKRLMHLRLKKPAPDEPEAKTAARAKKVREMQKAILLVRSSFSNCVTHQLHEHGFGPKEFLINIGVGLAGASVIVLIVYSGMKAAHLFGKAVAAAGSALAGGAMAVMNASKEKPKKKGPPEFPPKIQLAIEGLNTALLLMVSDSVSDLVYMIR